MRRIVLFLLSFVVAANVAVAQDAPGWAFEGVLTTIFESYDPVYPHVFTAEGHSMTLEEIGRTFDIRPGDPVVLIRDGAVAGKGVIGGIVARRYPEIRAGKALYLTLDKLDTEVVLAGEPGKLEALADGSYDLMVVTDLPVEVLAPDPLFDGIAWGVQDYVVRVGRKRYAVVRENDTRAAGFRGWSVHRFNGDGTSGRMCADYTWWAK